jgi:hypothetical protein
MLYYGNSFRCHNKVRIPKSNHFRSAGPIAGELGDRRDTGEMTYEGDARLS